tara:strand:- start:698 stop:859 length:162 start_codon:yes stop_codon:yes gene_type:complete
MIQETKRQIKSVTLSPEVIAIVNERRRETLESFSEVLNQLVVKGAKAEQPVQG